MHITCCCRAANVLNISEPPLQLLVLVLVPVLVLLLCGQAAVFCVQHKHNDHMCHMWLACLQTSQPVSCAQYASRILYCIRKTWHRVADGALVTLSAEGYTTPSQSAQVCVGYTKDMSDQ